MLGEMLLIELIGIGAVSELCAGHGLRNGKRGGHIQIERGCVQIARLTVEDSAPSAQAKCVETTNEGHHQIRVYP